MKITINGTTLEIIECKKVLGYKCEALQFKISADVIDSTTLNTLVFNNTGDVIVENNEGKTTTYIGYTADAEVLSKSDAYTVKLYSIPPLDRKIAELEAEKSALEGEVAELKGFVETEVDNAIKEGVNEID